MNQSIESIAREEIRNWLAGGGVTVGTRAMSKHETPVRLVGDPAPKRARKATKAAKAKPVAAAPKAGKRAKAKGEKRNPADIAALETQIVTHVAANPNVGVEAIGKALGVATKTMALPIKRLLKSGSLTSQGTKRSTRYSAKVVNGVAAHAN